MDPQNAPSQRLLAEDQLFSMQVTSINEAATEAGSSCIYGGVHFGFDDDSGLELGTELGSWVCERKLVRRPRQSTF